VLSRVWQAFCISIGNWRNDRQWDEVGSQATSSISESSDYRGMEEGDTIGSVEAPPDPNLHLVKIAASKQSRLFLRIYHRLDILGGQSCLSS
jgi:hypothetical protein